MKPHHLVIEALGPYPGTEEVDFDALAGEGLFLLHGPTGSGKTFVLDAIAFALYGSIPGARTTDGIRSDFAPPGARPSVTLEFTAQGHRYRVERSPGHERPKLRGSGTTTESHKAVLQVRDGSGWSPVAAKPTEVSREIQNLLGLDVEQFKQVVMLPQGGFQKVLRAGSDKREELLKTLFDIRSFDTFTKWLEDRAREARKSEETARTLLDDLVTRTRAAHRDLADRLGVEPPSETPEDEAPTDLAVLVEEALEWARAAARRAADAGRRAEAARTRLEVARARMKLWEQRAAARRELAQLQERAGEVARIEARLARATEAEGLRADLDAVEEAEAALADAEAELSAAVPNLARTLDAAPLLPPAAGRLVGDLPPTDDQAVEALEALAAHGARLKELALRRERAEELRRAADHSRREARILREQSETVEREAQSTASRLEAARVELKGALRRAEQVSELQQRQQEQAGRRRLEDELTAARATAAQARTTVEALEARRDEARTSLEDLRRRFVAGVAGRLAQDLVEGAGCPVCGSTHHPHPARPTADAVDADRVQEALERLEAVDRELEHARQAQAEAGAEAARLEGALGAGGGGSDMEALAAELKEARAAEQKVPALEVSIKALEDDSHRLVAEVADLRARAEARQAEAEQKQGQADDEKARVTSELGEGVEAEEARDAVAPVVEELNRVRKLLGRRSNAAARREAAVARLERALADSSFAGTFEARDALTSEEDRLDMARRCEHHHRRRVEVESLLASEEMAALAEESPDIDSAEAADREAAEERQRADRICALAESGHHGLSRDVAEITDKRRELDRLAHRAALHRTLADRCGGRKAPRTSLSRWVLAEYLREVCAHANQRLDVMTAGRYRLEVDEDGGKGNRKAGLDLMVHDSHTGVAREVNTLSGGETFLASLALALGVADTVQAHTGGVHLDALFVDEGFGTLDADTLQLAVDELDKLREGGRMVGVVSHVPALRERLRTGIEIIPGPQGSTLRQGEIAPV